MANKYDGTKTRDNLMAAFSGEAMAHTKYSYYSRVADKEGFKQISAIFAETSGNEYEHAKLWFKELGHLNDTLQNLKDAASGENYEWSEMYPEFARIAKEEGFSALAERFKKVADVEEAHEQRYKRLIERINTDTVFKDENVEAWKCRNCGYIHKGSSALEICPACDHPKAYFERFADNY